MLADDIANALPDLRAQAESLMADTLTAHIPGALVTDENGMEVPGYADGGTTLGKVAGPSTQSRDTDTRTVMVGNVEREVISGGIHLPLAAFVTDGVLDLIGGNFGTGWELEVTAIGAASDPALLGSRWLVVDVPAKSYATARRLDVVRLS